MTSSSSAPPSDTRAHVFPPPMDRHYPVRQGKIQTRSLEAHIVDHCNLTCAECCSLSPLLPEWFADPASIEHDLRHASRVLRPRMFKLVGGEPLLHPELVDIIERVRASRVTELVSVTTNGIRLAQMPEAFWRAVDALTISRYPKPALSAELIQLIEEKSKRYDVRLNWKVQDSFTSMTREQPTSDVDLARRIYHDCWIRERCHMIRDGMFYTCTRPAHFHTLYGGERDFRPDGIRLHDGADMLEELLAYLQQETPLQACLSCHGGSAALAPHRIMKRVEVQAIKARYR